MTESRLPAFFIADDPSLDFLNTVAAPWGHEIEWLASGADFLAWLEQAHLIPPKVSADFRAHTRVRELNRLAERARELREWFRTFVSSHAGSPLGRAALRQLAPVNALLEQDETYRQVEVAPGDGRSADDDRSRALRWHSYRRWRNPEALLLPLANAIGDLVCEKDFTLVRKCEGGGCTLWFLDVSKAHARRWCSMAVCGNRAKAAAHRARTRSSV